MSNQDQPTVGELLAWLSRIRDKCFRGLFSYTWSKAQDEKCYNELTRILGMLDSEGVADAGDKQKFDAMAGTVKRGGSERPKRARWERMEIYKLWNSTCLFILNYGDEIRRLLETAVEQDDFD